MKRSWNPFFNVARHFHHFQIIIPDQNFNRHARVLCRKFPMPASYGLYQWNNDVLCWTFQTVATAKIVKFSGALRRLKRKKFKQVHADAKTLGVHFSVFMMTALCSWLDLANSVYLLVCYENDVSPSGTQWLLQGVLAFKDMDFVRSYFHRSRVDAVTLGKSKTLICLLQRLMLHTFSTSAYNVFGQQSNFNLSWMLHGWIDTSLIFNCSYYASMHTDPLTHTLQQMVQIFAYSINSCARSYLKKELLTQHLNQQVWLSPTKCQSPLRPNGCWYFSILYLERINHAVSKQTTEKYWVIREENKLSEVVQHLLTTPFGSEPFIITIVYTSLFWS